MISVNPGIESLLEQLLVVLDGSIDLLGQKRAALAGLSAAIMDRDEAAVEALLARLDALVLPQQQSDLKMKALRDSLACAMGRSAEGFKLSVLVELLPPELSGRLDYRRRQIMILAQDLRAQHVETALLLRECARINRMLLECVTGSGQSVTTYGSGGKSTWRPAGGLLDAER